MAIEIEIAHNEDQKTTGKQHRKKLAFECTNCMRKFSTRSHLQRHSRVHTGERKYACDYPGCEMRCSRKDNLQQHYRTHLVVNPRRANANTAAQPGDDLLEIDATDDEPELSPLSPQTSSQCAQEIKQSNSPPPPIAPVRQTSLTPPPLGSAYDYYMEHGRLPYNIETATSTSVSGSGSSGATSPVIPSSLELVPGYRPQQQQENYYQMPHQSHQRAEETYSHPPRSNPIVAYSQAYSTHPSRPSSRQGPSSSRPETTAFSSFPNTIEYSHAYSRSFEQSASPQPSPQVAHARHHYSVSSDSYPALYSHPAGRPQGPTTVYIQNFSSHPPQAMHHAQPVAANGARLETTPMPHDPGASRRISLPMYASMNRQNPIAAAVAPYNHYPPYPVAHPRPTVYAIEPTAAPYPVSPPHRLIDEQQQQQQQQYFTEEQARGLTSVPTSPNRSVTLPPIRCHPDAAESLASFRHAEANRTLPTYNQTISPPWDRVAVSDARAIPISQQHIPR